MDRNKVHLQADSDDTLVNHLLKLTTCQLLALKGQFTSNVYGSVHNEN